MRVRGFCLSACHHVNWTLAAGAHSFSLVILMCNTNNHRGAECHVWHSDVQIAQLCLFVWALLFHLYRWPLYNPCIQQTSKWIAVICLRVGSMILCCEPQSCKITQTTDFRTTCPQVASNCCGCSIIHQWLMQTPLCLLVHRNTLFDHTISGFSEVSDSLYALEDPPQVIHPDIACGCWLRHCAE